MKYEPPRLESKTTALGLAAAVAAGALWASAAQGQQTITFGHVISTNDTQNEAYEWFAETVEERSDGRLNVEVYPDSQLGGERELIESVQAGEIQMTAPSVGVLSNFSDSLKVFDFPYIFEDKETAHQVLDGEIGQELLARLEDSDLVGLAWGENGFRNLAMAGDTIRTPSDLSGQSIRTMEVPLHIEYWDTVGASPTPLPFPEVFTSLQQGVVEGVENPYELLHSARFTEPADHLTETRHIYDPEVLLISEAFYDGLSDEDQEILRSTAVDAAERIRTAKTELGDEVISEIEEAGGTVTQLTGSERQEWKEAAIPIYEENADSVDTEMLRAILEAAENEMYLKAIQ